MSDRAVEVLLLLASGERGRAADLAAGSSGPLCAALAMFLEAEASGAVYDEAVAFQAFISHGTNPRLYERTIAAVAEVQRDREPRSVLDIGCGDGRVTVGSLTSSVTRLDLVEPAGALLAEAVSRVAGEVEIRARQVGVEEFLATASSATDGGDLWDLVQSTFAMHNLAPADRRAVWAELARRTGTLVIAEFDVPELIDRSEEHCRYLAGRYAIGIAEYADHPEVVQGFLMPVLIGQLEPGAPRYTFEQPVDRWAAELEEAGFTVSRRSIVPYWWADTWLLIAESAVQVR